MSRWSRSMLHPSGGTEKVNLSRLDEHDLRLYRGVTIALRLPGKEIKEEYCTDVLDYEFLGYRDVLRDHDGRKTHFITLDFKVLVDRKKVQNGEPHKFDAIEWFTLNNLPTPIHSQLPIFLEKYKDKLPK